jgi:hypothetical protein
VALLIGYLACLVWLSANNYIRFLLRNSVVKKLSQFQEGQISILERLAGSCVGKDPIDEIQNMIKELRLITKEIKVAISV